MRQFAKTTEELEQELFAMLAERDALKAKLAEAEAARDLAQRDITALAHGGEVKSCGAEVVRIMFAASESARIDERAARLKAEAACAAAFVTIKEMMSNCGCCEDTGPCANCQRAEDALSTGAGQPILDFIAAARRLNDGVKLFIKIKDAKRSSMDPPTGFNADDLPSFSQLVADVDAAEAKTT